MISVLEQRLPLIRQSKIVHKSPVLHPLARFVTEETAALLFNVRQEQIYRIDCWRYVVYVYGKGVSRFVSYADFPPILGVEPPSNQDFVRWRKRWYKGEKRKQAPEFWTNFYIQQFKYAASSADFQKWGQIVGCVKSTLSEKAIHQLRRVYQQEKSAWENICTQ